jgi:hypothetical protein
MERRRLISTILLGTAAALAVCAATRQVGHPARSSSLSR